MCEGRGTVPEGQARHGERRSRYGAWPPGQAAGRLDVEDSDQLKGETHTAARIIEDAGIDAPAGETVPIQARSGEAVRPR